MARVLRSIVVGGALALAVAACGSDGDDETQATTPSTVAPTTGAPTTAAPTTAAPTTAAPTTAAPAPTTTAAPAPEPWEQVKPGGDCQCADGSEFSFWQRKADPTKVVLFFQGGGACFSAETCAFASGNYKPNTGAIDDPTDLGGVFDVDDERNPFAGYSFVFVPYCTGDVHIGNATTAYSPELTVQHKGFVNATAVLDHIATTFPDAADVVVTGESAGSVPSPLYAGMLSDALPEASFFVLADGSGAYPDSPPLNATVGGLWGTSNARPDWPEAAGLTPEQWSLPGLFVLAGAHDPSIVFARHDYAFDRTQVFFGNLVGVAADDLLSLIDANEQQIEATGVDLASYISPGDEHTVLRTDRFYTEEVGGVLLVDWVTDLVNGRAITDVHCQECAVAG